MSGAPSGGGLPRPAAPLPRAPVVARPADPDEVPLAVTPDMLAPARRHADHGRVEFELGMRYVAPLTLALIAANIAIFGWEIATGALQSGAAIVAAGALQRDMVADAHEWWRLLSAGFLHGGVDHLVGNMLALYVLGLGCEHAWRARGMATVYAGALVAGSAASLAMGPGPSVGASGAIFGLLGALAATLFRRRHELVLRERRIPAVLAGWAGWTLLTGMLTPMVDNAAHVGGLVAGAALGWMLTPVQRRVA